jgi:uncharacterized protein
VRRVFVVVFGGLAFGLLVWALGRATDHLRVVHAGAGIAYAGLLVFAPAALVMPFGAAVHRAAGPPKPPTPEEAGKRVSRRALMRFGGASLPAVAAMTGASGFVTARMAPRLPVVTMRFPDLHPDIEGLRILQLSDLHLGAYLGLDDLDAGLEAAFAAHRPDLVVLTGDLADDVSLIAPALERIAKHAEKTRLGAFACLGNHEYLHGIEVTRPLFEASRVPLLRRNGRSLRVGRAKLFIGGADDPVHMSGDIAWMVSGWIREAAAHARGPQDFRLLLSHRPEGLTPASESGFDLVLSGHTHGGQAGLFGRSVFDFLDRKGLWWGRYAKGRTQLYTTSGMGHWFPFRVGCPTEMPLIVLSGAHDNRVAVPRQA